MTNIHRSLVIGCSLLALSACGPEDIASPGSGGNITINYPAPTPAPTPTPTSGGTVTAAADCPAIEATAGLDNRGTISGPTGTWRVCRLPATIDKSTILPKVAGLLYELGGRVDVGSDGGFTASAADTNVTLQIDPGVIVFGGTGSSWLAVNRGNKIKAVGTPTQPIIFTSRDNVLGVNSESSSGQWGGVVLLGRGKVTDCNYGSVGSNTCERDTEGAGDGLAIFGGQDDTYNAGEMDYVQIRFSGYVIGSNKELQSLTPEAIGSGTKLGHIMSYNSSDDGIEFFGGVTNLKHYIAVGAEDDSLDVDTGARVNIQYAIISQRADASDALLEIDSDGNLTDTPRTNLKVSNFTFVARNAATSDDAAMLFRGNSDVLLMNGFVIDEVNECLRINGADTTADFKSVGMQCQAPKYLDTNVAAGTAAAFFGTGADNNNDAYTNTVATLTSLFVNGSNETAMAVYDAKLADTFFDTTTYAGAVKDAADTWFAGWTCNSAIGNFGTGNSGLCTSLPTS